MSMRDFAKVGPTLWRSRKFQALGDDWFSKVIYLYCLTGPHCNASGCYDLPLGYAAHDLHCAETDLLNSLLRLEAVGLIDFDQREETLRITNWWTFNRPHNAKHALGCARSLRAASSRVLRARQAVEFEDVIKKWDDSAVMRGLKQILADFRYGIDTTSIYGDGDGDEDGDETRLETETRNLFEPPADRTAPRNSAARSPVQKPDRLNALLDQKLGKVRSV